MKDFLGEFTIESKSGLILRYTAKETNGQIDIKCKVSNRGSNTLSITIEDIEEDGKQLIDAAKYLRSLLSLQERTI